MSWSDRLLVEKKQLFLTLSLLQSPPPSAFQPPVAWAAHVATRKLLFGGPGGWWISQAIAPLTSIMDL